MNEDDARRLLLVRAVESEDSAETLLTREDRQQATAAALAEREDGRHADAAFLARRSAFAFGRLAIRFPALDQLYRRTRWPGWIDWALPITALVLGIATNEIDSGKRLNIIAFPLLGMLAWNLTVYALIVAHAAHGIVRRKPASAGSSWLARLFSRLAGVARRHNDTHQPLGRAGARFAMDWAKAASALTYARASRTLHLSAAALATGVIGGMYLRALGIEYRAGWESTFIGAGTLHRLLAIVLGPASAVTGIALPDQTHLASLRWSAGAGENAGRWIHLYATTALLFIQAPRLCLAAWSAWRAARLRRHFAVPGREDFYVRRLLRGANGGGTEVRIVPYSFTPPDAARQTLEQLLTAAFGDDTRVRTDSAIGYGDEEEWLIEAELRDEDDYLAVLFNLASTPEAENHGALVAGILRAIAAEHPGTTVAVVLDESGYRQRLAGQAGAAGRVEARRLAWDRMLVPLGVHPLVIDLDAGVSPDAVRRLEGALVRTADLAGKARA